jgi:peptidoglycan/xylan/chitin deacetylase (PgdA/CDA1 family)
MSKIVIGIIIILAAACNRSESYTVDEIVKQPASTSTTTTQETKSTVSAAKTADAVAILARKEVPVLCYHQISNEIGSGSKLAKDVIVPVSVFKAQMKMLADSGYHTILPDQLYSYLTTGAALPDKPVMLTYDDTDDGQFKIAAPEMKKYGFKGVFFIMTCSLNHPKYMTREQVKQLSDEGHSIQSHTFNHNKVPLFRTEEDWVEQVDKAKKQIEDITGKTADYFAYPYGLWNKHAITELKKRGVKAAFILSTSRDTSQPLYTIRRMIAPGYWNGKALNRNMIATFRNNR